MRWILQASAVLVASVTPMSALLAPLPITRFPCSKSSSLMQSVAVSEERPSLSTLPLQKQTAPSAAVTNMEFVARQEKEMQRLRAKDRTSTQLSKDDLQIVYEDDHIVVVDKPAGVLSVPTREGNPSLSQVVFEAVGCEMGRADMMVVHRLGMDTSGLMVLAKTREALLEMNTNFRTRQVKRHYEALVCGHVQKDKGLIDLPIMRDYEFPPYMRVSTEDHQRALLNFDTDIVGKKVLEAPKESLTAYEVLGREELEGQPISRVELTSISGRTHQLNVHCAALGHPIVGDKTYGFGGDAASEGGLTHSEQENLAPNPARASRDVMKNIAVQGKSMCVHANYIGFRHPISKEYVSFRSDSTF